MATLKRGKEQASSPKRSRSRVQVEPLKVKSR
jgi:hypothetical protein